jgi:para-aminobenzoate synthetase component 1
MPARFSSVELYRRLKKSNPATFSSYFDLGTVQIVSASPERLIACRDRILESRPIKGTRRRTGMPLVDLAAEEELLTSPKDLAENAMIVDLVRNDFSRICEDDSVEVSQYREIEKYESVLHLVSAIRGKLRSELTSWDALQAVFPGGSVTGAPKIRAIQIITEIEQTARGAYCGAIGYVGLDGSTDFSILIRTITAGGRRWMFPVGGAIVASSDPVQEYDETWVKAAGLIHACSSHENNN